MAAITWANVTNFVSGLSTVAADAQADILAYVNDLHDVSLFGGEDGATLKLLRIYLAAHLASSTAASSGGGGAGTGLVASESAGGLSRSYIYPDLSSDAGLDTSAYGREYKAIIKRSGARVGFAF
jgi:hypothetical protein